MALLECEECGGDVSSRALACPQCGCPPPGAKPKKRQRKRSRTPAIVLMAFVALAVLLWIRIM